MNDTPLNKTALFDEHDALGAHFTDFGGWSMPLRYGSELDEHRAVRERAGIFDLSHMGEIRVQGPESGALLDYAFTGGLSTLAVGAAKYSLMLTPEGGVIDDVIIYHTAHDDYLVVPNAANTAVVLSELQSRSAGFDAGVTDVSDETVLIAVQGPAALRALKIVGVDPTLLHTMPGYHAQHTSLRLSAAGSQEVQVLLARTGYTGEDGFEIYIDREHGPALWRQLLQVESVSPAGLAARDSLRLEAGYPLYGNELNRDVTPLEAGLRFALTRDHDFVGRAALDEQTPQRVLVGLRGESRRAGRSGYPVLKDGVEIGIVTSGQPSPTLGVPIALAYIDRDYASTGTSCDIDVRGTPQPFTVVKRPFYTRETPKGTP